MVVTANKEYLDKREKEAVNLVARASGEGRAIVRPNQGNAEQHSRDLRDALKNYLRFTYSLFLNYRQIFYK